jgi:hypothetical protein
MTLSTTNVLKRIVGPANMSSGTSTIFTGTGSHRYTIKNIRVVNNTAGAITFKLGIGGVTDALLIGAAITLAAGDTFVDDTNMVVLEGTETIQANTSATGLTVTISALDQS